MSAKIAYNNCFGGFSLSPEAVLRLYELGCTEIARPVAEYWPPETKKRKADDRFGYDCAISEWRKWKTKSKKEREKDSYSFLTVFSPDEQFVLDTHPHGLPRHDARLIKVIEELGSKRAGGSCAELAIEEIPDGAQYRINEYDGNESVVTRQQAEDEWITP